MSAAPSQAPVLPKRAAAERLLGEGPLDLHLDARRDDVIVPEHLKTQADLVLRVGHDLPVPIPDLALDDQGLTATLSFKRIPFHCQIPWSAIYALTNLENRGLVFQEDVPAEVRAKLAGRQVATPAPIPKPASIEVTRTDPAVGGTYRRSARPSLVLDARVGLDGRFFYALVVCVALTIVGYRSLSHQGPLDLVVLGVGLVAIGYASTALVASKLRIRVEDGLVSISRRPFPLLRRRAFETRRLEHLLLDSKRHHVDLRAALSEPSSLALLASFRTVQEARFVTQEIEHQLGRPLS